MGPVNRREEVTVDIRGFNVEFNDRPFEHNKFQKVYRISSRAELENDADPEYRDTGVAVQEE